MCINENHLPVTCCLFEIRHSVFSRFLNILLTILHFCHHFVERIYDKNRKIIQILENRKQLSFQFLLQFCKTNFINYSSYMSNYSFNILLLNAIKLSQSISKEIVKLYHECQNCNFVFSIFQSPVTPQTPHCSLKKN